ncbi:hypothetical protein PR048_024877 [Dryococelus australis]|uniref:Uncharacterized protein n=1 Tax=Dryococelus australis TaxID=614101 RepID=A0ABQ9GPR8_9NEOP|nr:hypothetical protein PR048_024877 [Dryococelus australis]
MELLVKAAGASGNVNGNSLWWLPKTAEHICLAGRHTQWKCPVCISQGETLLHHEHEWTIARKRVMRNMNCSVKGVVMRRLSSSRGTHGHVTSPCLLRTHTISLLTSHQGKLGLIPGWVTPGFSHMGIVPDSAAGRQVFSGAPISLALSFQHSILTSKHPLQLSRPCCYKPSKSLHSLYQCAPPLGSEMDYDFMANDLHSSIDDSAIDFNVLGFTDFMQSYNKPHSEVKHFALGMMTMSQWQVAHKRLNNHQCKALVPNILMMKQGPNMGMGAASRPRQLRRLVPQWYAIIFHGMDEMKRDEN